MSFSLAEIAQHIQGTVYGDSDKIIQRLCSLEQAQENDISFVNGAKYLSQAQNSRAGVLIVPSELVESLKPQCSLIEVASPYLAFALLTHLFAKPSSIHGISDTARIHPTAKIGKNVSIGDFVVIGAYSEIGDDSTIYPHCFIDENVHVGISCYIESNVSIFTNTQIGNKVRIHANTSIGGEGFGFAPYQGQWHRIVQLGKVCIGDNVRIGSNCSIDRGALNDTIIEDGVIIDNLVQIAHNVHIGKNTAIAAKTGIAGSTQIGENCIIAGACGISGHLNIADNVQLTGMSMVTKSITQAGTYSSGTGLLESASWRKAVVNFRQSIETPASKINKQIQKLQQRIEQLEQQLSTHRPNPDSEPLKTMTQNSTQDTQD